MLKAKWLKFVNIGRFTEPQAIYFDQYGQLIQVDAINMNTGGSSGSGKTTLFNAYDYLLGINEISNSLLQSRLTKNSILVSGGFDYDGKDLVLSRGKKGLSISLDGEVTTGSSKVTEEKLDQILGVSRNLFRSMLHKKQKEGGFFLKLTPTEVFDFLADCLNLTDLREKTVVVQAAAADLEKKITAKESEIKAASASLSATEKAQKSLGDRPEVVVKKDSFIEMKLDAENAEQTLALARADNEKQLNHLELDRPIAETAQFDETTIKRLNEEKRRSEGEITSIRFAEVNRQSELKEIFHKKTIHVTKIANDKKSQIAKLESLKRAGVDAKEAAVKMALQIKQVRAKTCFTCNQSWITPEAAQTEAELLQEVAKYKKVSEAGTEAETQISAINAEIVADKAKHDDEHKAYLTEFFPKEKAPREVELEAKIKELDAAIVQETQRKRDFLDGMDLRNRSTAANFAERVRSAREEGAELLKTLSEEARAKQKALDSAIGSLRAQQESAERYDRTAAQLTEQHSEANTKLKTFQSEHLDLIEEYKMAVEAKRAIKAYTSRRFDAALATISDTATRIIRQIPNMANATIEMKSTKETADGKIKEEVNAVIHNDGEENVPLKTLSGGERTSADLAVDLSAIEFLEDQAGKGIDLFILDEPFTGLEAVNIEAIVEMLKMSSLSKRIIIVDHNPVVAESFESKIIVKREGANSVVA